MSQMTNFTFNLSPSTLIPIPLLILFVLQGKVIELSLKYLVRYLREGDLLDVAWLVLENCVLLYVRPLRDQETQSSWDDYSGTPGEWKWDKVLESVPEIELGRVFRTRGPRVHSYWVVNRLNHIFYCYKSRGFSHEDFQYKSLRLYTL